MRRRQIYAAASRAIHDMAATPQQAFAGSAALAKADDETIEQFVASLDLPALCTDCETPAACREKGCAVSDFGLVKHDIPAGTCPTCGKHVGKGIAIHRRNCKG
jgi:hypothetical protein